MGNSSPVLMLHHGISPWELEVAYGTFVKKFAKRWIEYDGVRVSNLR